MRQKEWKGLANVARHRRLVRDQTGKGRGIGAGRLVGVAHHALRHHGRLEAGHFSQRALHQQLAHAHPKAAADQLDEQEAPCRIELIPPGRDLRRLRLRRGLAQGQQPLLDPRGQGQIAGARRCGQHLGDGLGQIAHRLIALLEQPVIDAGSLAGQRTQHPGGHHLTRLATREEIDRPGRVGRIRLGKITPQRRHLGVGGGAGIELVKESRKALHRGGLRRLQVGCGCGCACNNEGAGSPASDSSPNSVLNDPACSPCCCSQRTITAS